MSVLQYESARIERSSHARTLYDGTIGAGADRLRVSRRVSTVTLRDIRPTWAFSATEPHDRACSTSPQQRVIRS